MLSVFREDRFAYVSAVDNEEAQQIELLGSQYVYPVVINSL